LIAHIDERVWQQSFASVPNTALRQKKIQQLDREFEQAGFPGTASDTGWIQVSTAGRSLQETIQFMDSYNIVACTVEPADIPNWLGRNITSLAVQRSLEQNGAEALGLELLEPSEIADALQQLQFAVINHTDPEVEDDGGLGEEIALHDMRDHGLLTDEMERSYESFYREPEPQPEPDLSDYFPSASDDPWR
jgi:hypothetical protein